MARKPNARALPAPAPEILPAVAERIDEAQAVAIGGADAEDIFDLGAHIGRLEALDFVTTVGTSAMLSVYENVKKSKAWKFLPNPENSDGRNFESLSEFCRVKFGRSYSRLQELSANRRLIGEEAFEQAERLGLRQVDYNAIKSLPAPQQEMVRRAVEEASSREDVLTILQELAAAGAAQLAEGRKREADLASEIVSKEKRIKEKAEQIERLENELDKERARRHTLMGDDPDISQEERMAALEDEARDAAQGVKDAAVEVRHAFVAILGAFGDDVHAVPTELRVLMRAWVQSSIATLRGLMEDFALDGALDDDEIRADIAAAMAFSSEAAADESAAAA